MAANTKGKIIIGSALFVVVGVTAWIITSSIRKRRIWKDISAKLGDISLEGQIGNVSSEEIHKYKLALDPNFWKRTQGSPLPSKLMPDKRAREIATNIKKLIGDYVAWADDEEGIINEIKKIQTQGQFSQVAYAYSNPPLNYGDLGVALENSLKPYGTDRKDWLPELNRLIDSMPY